jgi:hypothetical protein
MTGMTGIFTEDDGAITTPFGNAVTTQNIATSYRCGYSAEEYARGLAAWHAKWRARLVIA